MKISSIFLKLITGVLFFLIVQSYGITEPINLNKEKVITWELVGSMYSEPGNWFSPRWLIFVDPSSISGTSDSGISVSVKMDFSNNPKCYPSLQDCSYKILIAYETHVLYCNSTTRVVDSRYIWKDEYHAIPPPTKFQTGEKLTIQKYSPLDSVIQPALCGKVNSLIDMSPSFIDAAMATSIIASGGIELNVVAFPLKLLGEVYGARNKGTEECVIVVGAVRTGGCMGIGATAVGLAGAGPWGMVLGGIAGGLLCINWTEQPARNTCYDTIQDKENILLKPPQFNTPGFNG